MLGFVVSTFPSFASRNVRSRVRSRPRIFRRMLTTTACAKATEGEVRRVANLAQLELSDEDITKLTPEFQKVIDFFNSMNELDLEGIEPMSTPNDASNVVRNDRTKMFSDMYAAHFRFYKLSGCELLSCLLTLLYIESYGQYVLFPTPLPATPSWRRPRRLNGNISEFQRSARKLKTNYRKCACSDMDTLGNKSSMTSLPWHCNESFAAGKVGKLLFHKVSTGAAQSLPRSPSFPSVRA